jgi:hypothetical protein
VGHCCGGTRQYAVVTPLRDFRDGVVLRGVTLPFFRLVPFWALRLLLVEPGHLFVDPFKLLPQIRAAEIGMIV